MLLSRGVTGFYDSKSPKPEEKGADYFRRACYIADCSGFPIITICCPENYSYYTAQLIADYKPVYLLMNRFTGVFAYCTEIEGKKEFTDLLSEPLAGRGYNVALSAELNYPFDKAKHELSKAELDQVKYWQPQTVGEVIFNEWD